MNESDLRQSIKQYKEQLQQVKEALKDSANETERDSLLSLQTDLEQLVSLTEENLAAVAPTPSGSSTKNNDGNIDDEYALFMMEMAESGAYNDDSSKKTTDTSDNKQDSASDIEDELSSLPGTKCSVFHTHKWGGQPTLYNAMVASVESHSAYGAPLQALQVRVLFTHPTHPEMLPCPFYFDGECKFSDEQCRYSHGDLVPFVNIRDAIEPKFENLKPGSYVLVKLKPPDGEDISLTKKSSEKYHLWHRGIVKRINIELKNCLVQLEQGVKVGDKRKQAEEITVLFEELFPLHDVDQISSESDDSLSDTEYPQSQRKAGDGADQDRALLVEKSLEYSGPSMGEWERHTRGIGSKLMFAMGYVAGTGLGVSSDGRLEPVPARVLPVGKSLDHCMKISETYEGDDRFKIEKKLKHLQKKEEERNKRAYEREKEKERQNVFNFLNKTLNEKKEDLPVPQTPSEVHIKNSSMKSLNIEQFKITEEVRKVERDLIQLKNTLYRHAQGSNIHKNISAKLADKSRELDALRCRERDITKEQTSRKDKQKMTLF